VGRLEALDDTPKPDPVIFPYRAYCRHMKQTDLGEPAFWILTVLATGRNHGYAAIRASEEGTAEGFGYSFS